MNTSPFFDFRPPEAMSPQERFAEVVAILARGLGRYVDDLPAGSQMVDDAPEESAKVLLNQLDKDGKESVHDCDENA